MSPELQCYEQLIESHIPQHSGNQYLLETKGTALKAHYTSHMYRDFLKGEA